MAEYIVNISEEIRDDGSQEILNKKPLIRCKDCKYWDADDHDCNIKIGWFACGADWFCADGERQEGR